jgi:hypothetical protein
MGTGQDVERVRGADSAAADDGEPHRTLRTGTCARGLVLCRALSCFVSNGVNMCFFQHTHRMVGLV